MDVLPRNAANDGMSPITFDLLITLLVLVIIALLLTGSLLALKRYRRSKTSLLPTHTTEGLSPRRKKHQRTPSGFTITTIPSVGQSKSLFVYNEKQELANRTSSPPPDTLPEIRITFPEEVDNSGKRSSGRVVVVRVGETGLGMEPVEENLPPYQKNASDRFQSLDLERIGGLKEKQGGH